VTTKHSPLSTLKAQSDRAAAMLKAFERGDSLDSPALRGVDAHMLARIGAARLHGEFSLGIVMDDKFIKVTLPWPTIASSGEVALSEFILKLMREERAH